MNDFIGTYKIPADVALNLSLAYDENPGLHVQGAFIKGRERVVDLNVKDCLSLAFSELGHSREVQEYYSALGQCLKAYKEEYEWCTKHQTQWGCVEDSNIQVYPPGGGYKIFHYERTGGVTSNRHLAFMTFLCDIPTDEGGGTEFFYQKRVLPCQLGLTAIWPAEWTHTHRGMVCHTREKRIATGWYSFF